MIIRKSLLALALAASCALAALPSTMLFQGNMVVDGKPVSGNKELKVSLYDDLTAGTEVWTKTYTAMFNNGYYAVELDNLESVDFSKPLFVGLAIGTEISASRIPLTMAPYAKRAAVAESADRATIATKAETADALVSAADKSVALKDGNGKTQVTVSPNGGIQLPVVGTLSSTMTTDPRGVCNMNSRGRIVYASVAGLVDDRLYVCKYVYLGSGSMGYAWKEIATN